MWRTAVRALTGQVHPAVIVSVLVGLVVFIPYIARVILPDSSIHPVSFVAAAVAVLVVLLRSNDVFDEFRLHWPLYVAGATVSAVALAITLLTRGDYGKAYVVNHMVVPIVVFALIQIVLRNRAGSIQAVCRTVVIMGCVQVALGILQLLTQSTLVFRSSYGEYSWLETMISEGRVMGTLDHPLVMALFLLICIPLSFSFSNVYLRSALSAMLVLGTFLTQSRLAVVAAVAMLILLCLQAARSTRTRALVLGGLGLVVLAILVSPLGQTVLGRFQDDQGSNTRRFVAIDLYLKVWTDHIFSGTGLGSSYAMTGDAALKSSFENPVLMMAVDIGLLWSLIWVGMQIVLALGLRFPARSNGSSAQTMSGFVRLNKAAWKSTASLQLAAVAALVFAQSFSSSATESASSMLVWIALALFTVQRTTFRADALKSELAVAGTIDEAKVNL